MSSCEKASQWTTALALLDFVGKIPVRRSIVSYNTALDLENWKGHRRFSLGSGKWWDTGTSHMIHFHPPCLAFLLYNLSEGNPFLGLLLHHKVMSACVSTENWQLAMDLHTEAMQSTMRSVVFDDGLLMVCPWFAWVATGKQNSLEFGIP